MKHAFVPSTVCSHRKYGMTLYQYRIVHINRPDGSQSSVSLKPAYCRELINRYAAELESLNKWLDNRSLDQRFNELVRKAADYAYCRQGYVGSFSKLVAAELERLLEALRAERQARLDDWMGVGKELPF